MIVILVLFIPAWCLFLSLSFKKALASYTKVNKVHLSMLRSLASQASVIIEVVLAMGSILPAYMTSYNCIKSMFEFVKKTGRLAIHVSLYMVDAHCYVYYYQSLLVSFS